MRVRIARGRAESFSQSKSFRSMAAAASAAIASNASASSRRSAAERASAAEIPGPKFFSITGNTFKRTLTRENSVLRLCGSFQKSKSTSRQACSVCSRVIARSGRIYKSFSTAIPDRERAPEPRAKPSRTVSAWSSLV